MDREGDDSTMGRRRKGRVTQSQGVVVGVKIPTPSIPVPPFDTREPDGTFEADDWKFVFCSVVFATVALVTTYGAYAKASADDHGCAVTAPARLLTCVSFSRGTPCYVRSMVDSFALLQESARKCCIDKFALWEIASLAQTLVVSCIVFFEIRVPKRPVILLILLNVCSVVRCLQAIIEGDWHNKLMWTAIFLSCLTGIDAYLWWQEKADLKLRRMIVLTLFLADLPILFANLVLVAWLWNFGDSESHVFFEGASALSLMFSKVLVFLIRLDKHWHLSRRSPLNAI
jgi:hypothetical protein